VQLKEESEKQCICVKCYSGRTCWFTCCCYTFSGA